MICQIPLSSAMALYRFRPYVWLLLSLILTNGCLLTHSMSWGATDAGLPVLEFLKEETVVTPLRNEQPISQAPSNIYVITDEDIRLSGATDIPTLLRRIPGMDVMDLNNADINVSIRGNNQLLANKLLIMVDGRSIYNDFQGSISWRAIPVTLPEIKRIEVIKGPTSSLYGFNAFDGIIHIITKSSAEIKGTTVQVGGGQVGTLTSSLVHAGSSGDLSYRLSAGWDQNNQWDPRDDLASRGYRVNLESSYDLSGESRVMLAGGVVDLNKFEGAFIGNVILSTDVTFPYMYARYERPNFFLRAFWNGVDTKSFLVTNSLLNNLIGVTAPNGSSKITFTGDTYNLEAQHTVEFATAHQMSYGANYRFNRVSCNCIAGTDHENRLGLYIQDEWKATPDLRIVAGVRYDLHSEIPGTWSPRLAVIYHLAPDHAIRSALSLGYHPPTLLESNQNTLVVPNFPAPTSTISGTSNLDPEQIIAYDIDYQGWYFQHRLRTRLGFFYNHISDLISIRPISQFQNEFVNGEEADIWGGEAGMEFWLTPWLSGFFNVVYQEIGQTNTGRQVRGAPLWKGNVGLRAEWENGVNGEVTFHHVGGATYPIDPVFTTLAGLNLGVTVPDGRVESYQLLNLRGGYRFWNEKAELAITAYNALNDRHREHPLGQKIGSRVMGWLTLRLF